MAAARHVLSTHLPDGEIGYCIEQSLQNFQDVLLHGKQPQEVKRRNEPQLG